MKTLKIFSLLILIFINISLFADKKVQENILLNKDIQYSLRIEGGSTKIQVYINDVNIYFDYSRGNFSINYPVNKFIRTGKNEIKFKLNANKDQDYKLDKKSNVKVELLVKNFKTREEYVVSTLKYTESQENKTIGSTVEGKYSSLNNFVMDKKGNVQVDIPIIESYSTKFGNIVGGVIVSQNVYFETAYPKWKFLDSEDIIEKRMELYTIEELIKFKERPDIKELYNIYTKIHTALKNKNAESIIDMFEERNTETDIAWNDKEGSAKASLLEGLKDASEDDNNEIIEFIHEKRAYFIEDNLKLIYIPAISWNKKTGGSREFTMRFRRENGKWILTR